MRPVLIVLLVMYHAFAPYCGAWVKPQYIENVDIYRWIAHFASAFRLEGFVFISGYVFTFQLQQKNKFVSVWNLVKSKAERLLLPCVVFGLIYYLLFFDIKLSLNDICKIFNGIAHLWYLPCLFWLFVVQYIIVKYTLDSSQKYKCLLVLCVSVLPIVSIIDMPLQLGRVAYYLMFFYGGGFFFQYYEVIVNKCSCNKVMILWVLFVIVVLSMYMVIENNDKRIELCLSRVAKLPYCIANVYLKIIIAWIGIIALYMTALLFSKKHRVNDSIIKIGTYGYGVYVFHQFILIYLYRKTTIPAYLGSYYLPWFGFIITLIFSFVLAYVVRKTVIGKRYL